MSRDGSQRYARRGNENFIEELEIEIAEGSLDWGAIFALIAAIAAFTAAAVLIVLSATATINLIIAIVIWLIGFIASLGILIFCIRAKVAKW